MFRMYISKFRERRRGIVRTALISLASLVSGALSWQVRVSDPWWSSTLGNVAVAIFLLVPGERALSWITSSFRQIEQATEKVRVTAEAAKTTADRAEQSLLDVRQALM